MLRVLYTNTNETFIKEYIESLRVNHNIVEYGWQENQMQNETGIGVGIDASGQNHIDMVSVDMQNKYIKEYLEGCDVSEEDIAMITNINIDINNKIEAVCVGRGVYKLLKLEFSNLFSFGNDNIINFSNLKGVVGIIAPNHLGKSAIIDILSYVLFDNFTRKGNIKDIININCNDFRVKLDVSIGEWIYTIIKEGVRKKTGSGGGVAVNIEFYRTSVEGYIERLEETTATQTKERIMEYFGTYSDIINTSFSVQHDNSCFIDATNVKRKDELERIMRIDIIKKISEIANQHYNKDKIIYEHLKHRINNDQIIIIKDKKDKLDKLLLIIINDKKYVKECIARLCEKKESLLITLPNNYKNIRYELKEINGEEVL
jgi:DNA repair exonuclease SbcCD ATPase subunit